MRRALASVRFPPLRRNGGAGFAALASKTPFELPPLPYSMDALEPHISKETLQYHYGKHYAAYVSNLNRLVESSQLANKSLEEIITSVDPGPVFNNAAQSWKHKF